MSDPTAATGTGLPAPRVKHQRKLSNYLLDRSLQLRYVLLVTVLSAVIAGTLGYMIYDQRRTASESIERDLKVLVKAEDFQEQVVSSLQSDDENLIYKMVAVGMGLVVILSAYLVIMTHKVAGPLFKISMYFDRMTEGRLGVVTALRKGDMLQDFFTDFKAMHEAVRAKAIADVDTMEHAMTALRTGEPAGGELDSALSALSQHIAQRKKQLA